ncbi:MAG TPA: SDR family oxidoreductase, partial [Anaerolineaceae bacterium]|nr:SDR family oxidoreductase [Anaerolineaceae bacterium]
MSKTALITGATGGLGEVFAELFAADGIDLVLTARNLPKMEETAERIRVKYDVKVELIPQDLSVESSAEILYEDLSSRGFEIDFLVNNAGFGDFGRLIDIDWRRERDLIGVNLIAPVRLTQLFAKDMVARGFGRVLNVASIAAWTPGPYMNGYFASKAYVYSFSQSVHQELKGTGITVTALCPGPTQTGFEKNAEMKNSNMFKALKVMDARFVAKVGYRDMMKGKPISVPDWYYKVYKFILRFAPECLVRRIAAWVTADV